MKNQTNKIDLVQSVLKHKDILNTSSQQADFVLQPLNYGCFLSACPGSGKTHSVSLKFAYEINNWISKASGIAVLSFTNNAADEIKKRANYYLEEKSVGYPHFVGTIDSWIHAYIFHPFAKEVTGFIGQNNDYTHKLIQEGNHGPWIKNYSYKSVSILDYTFDKNDELLPTNDKIRIDNNAYTINTLLERKLKFAKDGFVTYSDIEYWTYKVLQKRIDILHLIAQRFPFIIIDECQDLSEIQLEIFELLKQAGVSIHLVGDLDQSIYEFRNVFPENVRGKIITWGLRELELSTNYRSVQQICDVITKLSKKQQIIGTKSSLNKSCLLWVYDKNEDMQKIRDAFINLLKMRNINIEDAAVIARGSSLVNKLKGYEENNNLNKVKNSITYKIASAMAHWQASNVLDKQYALQTYGNVLVDLVYEGKGIRRENIKTPYSYQPMEWRLILKNFLNRLVDSSDFMKNGVEEQTWKDWIKNVLKTEFNLYMSELKEVQITFEKVSARLRSPNKLTETPISKSLLARKASSNSKIKVDTIHGVKGESYKAVLFVSSVSKNSDGGHFEQWLQQGTEANRFAFVACSRPQELLVLAIPKNNKEILDLGFYQDQLEEYYS
ncbi:UvrD-helicase domain-containing protein [Virgibacillus halophilus]